MIIDIDTAFSDPKLLGAAFKDQRTWNSWRIILRAAFGLELTDDETVVFKALAGGREPPRERVSELWICAGRRSGKSRIASAIATYLGTCADYTNLLTHGEIGHVLALAPSRDQAAVCMNYASGHFAASEVLRHELESESANELRLRGNVVIGIHSASFRTIRGRTVLAAIFDELAFWRSDESASPDREVYRAILPALGSTNGMLICISSPYRKIGLLYEKWRDHFGQNDDDILVIQSESTALNPTINRKIIERAREDDPAAALSEWDANFRTDLSSYLDDEAIDLAIDRNRPPELPPRAQLHRYFSFTDASAGKKDSFTLAIAHREGDRVVIDALRGHKPPFDPVTVAREYALLARTYGCREIVGDAFGGEWTAGAFRDGGISYRRSSLPRSGLYLEALPLFARGMIQLPNHPQLVRELRLLERRTTRSGKDSVDHGQGGSDDYANSVAGAAYLCVQGQKRSPKAQVGKAGYTRSTQNHHRAHSK